MKASYAELDEPKDASTDDKAVLTELTASIDTPEPQLLDDVITVPKGMFSRMLYSNPVCLLTSSFEGARNIMTISWLTALTNTGDFICSINCNRHSASLILPARRFVLNIPVGGQEELVRQIGGCSGRDVDKLATLPLKPCEPGWFDIEGSHDVSSLSTKAKRKLSNARSDCKNDFAIAECVGHIVCTVDHVITKPDNNTQSDLPSVWNGVRGHHLLFCKIVYAYVRQSYWSGRSLVPANENTPPLLSFQGSSQFLHMSAGVNDV